MAVAVLLLSSCADEDPPIITLNGDTEVESILNATYTDEGATAEDEKDGDVTSSIVVDGDVDNDLTGTYTLTYNVSDAAGNDALPVNREVTVRNEVDYLEGFYFVTANQIYGTSTGTPTNQQSGTDDVSASTTVNNRFFLSAFPVYCDVNGSDILIPVQESIGVNWSGSGTIDQQGNMTILLLNDNSFGAQTTYELYYNKN